MSAKGTTTILTLLALSTAGIGGYFLYNYLTKTFTVNGSYNPITVSKSSVLAFSARGMTPNGAVQVAFNGQPAPVAGMFVAAQGTADANGNFNVTYQLVPPGVAQFYAAAYDASKGKYTNWVQINTY